MKFDIEQAPTGVYGTEPQVGDVYRVQGGRGAGRRLQVIVALSDRGSSAQMLVLDTDGTIIGATQYGTHVFERRERVGHCQDLKSLTLPISWEFV